MVKSGDFCKVATSKYAEFGVKRGDVVYIAGDYWSPIEEEDPYVYRKLFVAAQTRHGHVQGDGKEFPPFTCNGLYLKNVSKKNQAWYKEVLDQDYSQETPKIAEEEA